MGAGQETGGRHTRASVLAAPPPPAAAERVRRLFLSFDFISAATAVARQDTLPAGLAGVLVRLLLLDLAVSAEVGTRLGPLLETGLIDEQDGWLVPRVRVALVDGVLVVGDPPRLADHAGFVAPVSATSRTVAALTVRARVATGLDLCTGSGVLALLLARHCAHVVATDVAPRALAWAAFNAALNDVGLDLRLGSLTAPVAGERFDVVSANPPYVIGLDGGLVYRDSPLPGDGVSELVVRALPDLLRPDGWATTTLSWAGTDGTRPRQWLGPAAVESWLLTGRRLGAMEHALAWVGTGDDPTARGVQVDRWTAALLAGGTTRLCEGALVVHAGAGAGHWREDDLRLPVTDPQGDRIVRAVRARQPLVGATVVRLAPDVRITGEAGTRIVRWDGLLADLHVDPHTAGLLASVDGLRPVSLLVQDAVGSSGAAAPELVRRAHDAVRELVDGAVLTPVADPAPPASVGNRGWPAPVLAPGTGRPLAAALATAGYRAEPLAALLGTTPSLLVRAADLPVYPLRTPATGLGALARLLLLGHPVPRRELPDGVPAGALTAAGLARADGDRLVPTAQLVPHGDLLIACDLASAEDRRDVVVGVQPPTATLADLTPRRPVRRALDLGTGCGLQAILLARHARHVVATDVNPRALAFAAANAELAGVQIELREGAWFAPVRGEVFDLVVTNPPYVLSPGARWAFRDAGLPRDGASRLVAEGLPQALTEGGIGVALLSWVDAPGPPPPLQWSSAQGCDALLLATGTADAWQTATAWNNQPDPAHYAAEVARWLGWLSEEGIAAVEYGALVLSRTGGGAARRVGLPGRPAGPAGEQVLRLVRPPDVLGPDSVLLPVPDTVLERLLPGGSDGWGSTAATLRQAGGLRLATSVDETLLAVLGRLAPGRTLRDVAGPADALTAALPALTSLLAMGLLVSTPQRVEV